MVNFTFGCAMFNVASFVLYALINFGMCAAPSPWECPMPDACAARGRTVDAEIDKIAKANVAHDKDSDGILDWSEFRNAADRHNGTANCPVSG